MPGRAIDADVKLEEVFLVTFVLILWVVVIRLFFHRWGNIVIETQTFQGFYYRQDP